jgi:hypothetical protein
VTNPSLVANHQVDVASLAPATLYHYRVVSADAAGNAATSTDQTFTTLPDTTPPANVTGFTAVPGNQQIALSWANPVDVDFAGVRIRRSTTGYPATPTAGTAVYDASGTSTLNTGLTNGTLYYYAAFAYDSSGNFATGAVTNGTPADAVAPGPITGFASTPGDGQNLLAWTNPGDADFSNVVIRRSTAGYPANPAAGSAVYSGVGTSHADTGLVNGTTYYYSAFARDTSNNFSGAAQTSGTPVDVTPPGPVTAFTINSSSGQNQLGWTNPTAPDFQAVTIRRSLSDYPDTPSAGIPVYTGSGTAFNDTGLINGTTYYYAVFAYDEVPNYSAPAQGAGTPSAAPPPPTVCGNGICESGETTSSCPTDCTAPPPPPPVGPTCGNGSCEVGETNASCPADCPITPVPPPSAVCGNAICEGGETYVSCPADCQAPAPPVATPSPSVPPTQAMDKSKIEYYALSRTLALRPDAYGYLHILPEKTLTVTIPPSAFSKPVQSIALNFAGNSYLFSRSSDGSQHVDVVAPKESAGNDGRTSWFIRTAYAAGPMLIASDIIVTYADASTDLASFTAQIDPYGSVHDSNDGPTVKVSGALVTLYQKSGPTWQVWNAGLYSQLNPVTTGADGAFAFMVPTGEYYLEITKSGYRKRETAPVTITSNVINPSVELIKLPPAIIDVIIPGAPLTENIANVAANLTEQTTYVTKIIQREIIEDPRVIKTARNVAVPAATAVSTVVVATAVQATNIVSYLYFIITQPILLIGRRKRKEFGTVYNGLSKLPIDLAIVRIFRTNGKLVRTSVTDKQGRFAFLIEEGEYRIEATKPGFKFPSDFTVGRKEDGRYLDIYHGEPIVVGKEGAVIAVNIPLDPVEKIQTNRRVIMGELGRKLQSFMALASVGFTLIIMAVYRQPYLIIMALIQMALYFMFKRLARPPQSKNWGIIYDEATKRPLSYAIARIIETQYNKVLESRVTDSKGRYNFLVGNNRYFVSVERAGYETKRTAEIDMSQTESGGAVISIDIPLTQKNGPAPKP